MNVNIKSTEFANTIQDFATRVKSVGEPSDFIKKVQIALICRYYLLPGDETGMNDRKTISAVLRYQADRSEGSYWAFNMPVTVDGKVGPQTLGRLLPPTIALGSKVPQVLLAQNILHAWGYAPGHLDGDFGPNTEAAVKDFQSVNEDCDGNPLEPDGVVGERTWAALWS